MADEDNLCRNMEAKRSIGQAEKSECPPRPRGRTEVRGVEWEGLEKQTKEGPYAMHRFFTLAIEGFKGLLDNGLT